MKSPSMMQNVMLVAVYAAVAVGLSAVWQMHREGGLPGDVKQGLVREAEPAVEAPLRAVRGDAATAAPSPPSGPEQPVLAFQDPRGSGPARRSSIPADGRRTLILPESPPASDPAVAERQRKIPLGDGVSLGGMRPFPDDNPWNRDISHDPVDPLSEALLRSIGWETGLHPCFGRGEPGGTRDGIPYVVVSSVQPRAPIEFVEYGDESDPGPYPIPARAPVEGEPETEGDRHVLVIDRDEWKLYELYRAFEVAGGWRADCGAVWDLKTNHTRPLGITSADAAGLPIFPGLVRYDEVAAGEIRHALRFTVARSRRAFVPPASHWASRDRNPLLPPMGMRVRLKAEFDISGFPRDVQVILTCLKKYGMLVADNGSNWFITGAPDERWDDDALHTLKRVQGRDFEVVRMDGLVSD